MVRKKAQKEPLKLTLELVPAQLALYSICTKLRRKEVKNGKTWREYQKEKRRTLGRPVLYV